MEYRIIEHAYGNGTKYYSVRIKRWFLWVSISDYYFNSVQEAEDYVVSYVYGLLSCERVVKKGVV